MKSIDPVYICDVCKRVLDHYMRDDGIGYRHTAPDAVVADHDAVAVPMPEDYQSGRCDFCNTNCATGFSVPARDFIAPDFPSYSSGGDWLACPECGPLIRQGDWSRLTIRVVRPDLPYRVRKATTAFLMALRENITGPLCPYPNDAANTHDPECEKCGAAVGQAHHPRCTVVESVEAK